MQEGRYILQSKNIVKNKNKIKLKNNNKFYYLYIKKGFSKKKKILLISVVALKSKYGI